MYQINEYQNGLENLLAVLFRKWGSHEQFVGV